MHNQKEITIEVAPALTERLYSRLSGWEDVDGTLMPVECDGEYLWWPDFDLANEAILANLDHIDANGKASKCSYIRESRQVDEIDDNPILDWCCYENETIEVTVVRNRFNTNYFLITNIEVVKRESTCGYEENDRYDVWEARQIAEFERVGQ